MTIRGKKISQESLVHIHFGLIGQNGATWSPLAAREAVLNIITVNYKGRGIGG